MKLTRSLLYQGSLALLTLITLSCGTPGDIPEPEILAGTIDTDQSSAKRLIATVTDGASGSISTVDISPPYTPAFGINSTGPSSILRQFGNRIYLVDRASHKIDLLHPQSLQTIRSFDLGDPTLPMDVLELDRNSVLFSDYNSSDLKILDLRTGEIRQGLSLSGFSDQDGLPEAVMMEKVGSRIYVQLQRIDQNTNTDHGAMIAVVGLLTNDLTSPGLRLVSSIRLAGKRPQFKMQVNKEKNILYVACPGVRLDHFSNTGIEEVDLTLNMSLGFFITEEQLGGDMGPFAITAEDEGFCVFHTSIVASTHLARIRRGQSLGELHSTIDGWADVIAYDQGSQQIFYGEPSIAQNGLINDKNGHMIVYDAQTGTQLSGLIGIGGMPYDFLIQQGLIRQ